MLEKWKYNPGEQDNNDSTGTCKPCLKAAQAIKKSARRKTQSSSAPAKKKAPLAACGADKLRATVKAQRLECKQLEARLDQLQTEIKKDGVGVSEGLEKDILTIMHAWEVKTWRQRLI